MKQSGKIAISLARNVFFTKNRLEAVSPFPASIKGPDIKKATTKKKIGGLDNNIITKIN